MFQPGSLMPMVREFVHPLMENDPRTSVSGSWTLRARDVGGPGYAVDVGLPEMFNGHNRRYLRSFCCC